MHLFQRTYLQGMHDGLVDSGAMQPFPDDETAAAGFDKIAEEFGFPVRLDRNLTPEEALPVAQRMKFASDTLTANGHGANATRIARVKTASTVDIQHRAAVVSAHYMDKAAGESGSLVNGDPNTPQAAARNDQLAAVDQANRPEGTYRGPRGETALPTPGVVGRETAAPGAPQTKTAGRLADLLASLKKAPEAVRALPGDFNAAASRGLAAVGGAIQRPGMSDANFKRVQNVVDRGQQFMADHPNAIPGAAAAASVLGTTGAGLGLHHVLSGHPQMSPEDLAALAMNDQQPQGMAVTASAQDVVGRSITFMSALNNIVPDMSFTPEVKVASVGLASIGAPGINVMHEILSTVKTAEDADQELAAVLHALTEQGIPPSPELVHALEEALNEPEGDVPPPDGGMPPGAPAEGAPGAGAGPEPKMGALSDLRTVGNAAKRLVVGNGSKDLAKRVLKNALPGAAKTLGIGAAGTAAVTGAGVGVKKFIDHRKAKKNEAETPEEEKAASLWAAIEKAAGEGSLTDTDTNTPESAAKTDQLAAVDQKNRKDGKYENDGKGKTELKTEAGEVGDEKKAHDIYQMNIEATARAFGGKLPAAMPLAEKQAHIVKLAGIAPNLRDTYLSALFS